MNPPHQQRKHLRRTPIEFAKASKRRHRQQITTTKTTPSSSALRTNSPTPDEISIWPITNLPAEIWQLAAICITACISLLLMEFVANETVFAQFFPPHPGPADSYWVLRFKVWWVAWALIAYIALPTIVILLLSGTRLRDCNLSWQGFRQHYSVYVVLYAAVLPVIWLVSLSPDFYNFYPMYGQAGRSWFDLLAWEGLYAGQFVALEFFFRGFLVGGLSRYIGIFAVPVSVMPYMMIHFTKPWPEALASIVAGLVLGSLAWKMKSIWGGVCVHCAVAITMDLLALSHKGQLPWLHG
jgi:membrane protease YdiL (CAAX protease family)